ncbi:hypothetical protein BGZ49_007752 [Haplosporangium sp. Z 27]|nr:hypothetical protein BGZ49_007752 [Haplosporangium sp. Z 27]
MNILCDIELDIFQWDKHQFAKQDFTIPESYDTLKRIDYDKVSREEFIEEYEEKCLPVMIRGVTEGWGACNNWNSETFLRKYYSQPFKVGEDDDGNNVYVKMKYFLKYAEAEGANDDSPLYIFDSGFVKRKLTPIQKKRISGSSSSSSSSSERKVKSSVRPKVNSSGSECEANIVGSKRARSWSSSPTSNSKKISRTLGKRRSESPIASAEDDSSKEQPSKREEEHASTLLQDFIVPKYFKDDLFQLTGDRRRPPYRWFIVGGARSGTGIHIDPLGTSAWNTLTTGHKRWCLFPPGIPREIYDPPMKPFDREAVSWFHHVYPRFAENDFELGKKYGMIQVIQGPGETMFVPGGWPHIVMNLDFTIAITQNFCSPTNFETVWLNTRHARPKLARKLQSEIERMYNKTGRCFYKDLLEKCRSLTYVPMLRMSTDDSSSSSSSSDSSDDMTSTESESDIGEICMCHKCKKKRRKEERRKKVVELPDDQPVALLRVAPFKGEPEKIHYIYPGITTIGYSENLAHIFPVVRTAIDGLQLRPKYFYQWNIGKCVIRQDHSSGQDNQLLNDFNGREQGVFCVPTLPQRRRNHNDDGQAQVPENHSDYYDQDSLASTQAIEELTISIRDDSSSSSNFSGTSQGSSDFQHEGSLPITDILVETQNSYSLSEGVDHDAPTQIQDPMASLNNLPIDPDAPTQALDSDDTQSFDETQAYDETLPYEDTRSVPSDNEESSVQDARSPQLVASSMEVRSVATKELDIPDSQQERVCQTQPTQSDDAQTTQSFSHSRQPSVEPTSQEVSQILPATSSENSGNSDALCIPATPDLVSGGSQLNVERSISIEDNEFIRADQRSHSHSRQLRPILMDSQEPISSSPHIEKSFKAGYATDAEQNLGQAITQPSSQTSTVSREGSPKHELDSDSGESSPKPTKLIKTESVEGATAQGRATPSRLLGRRSMTESEFKPTVMISYMTAENKTHWEDVIKGLTGVFKDGHKDATLLVFEGNKRTFKFMYALAKGLPIVSLKWLTDSQAAHRCLKYENYLYCDLEIESLNEIQCKHEFNLVESCRKAEYNRNNGGGIFKDHSFYIITKGKKKNQRDSQQYPQRNTLVPLVEVSGGKVLKLEPKDPSENIIIIGPDDYCAITQEFVRNKFHVMKADFIMSAVLKQEIDFTKHRIPTQDSPTPGDGNENSAVDDGDQDDVDSEYDESDAQASKPSSSRSKKSRQSKSSGSFSRSLSSVSATDSVVSRKGSVESIPTITAPLKISKAGNRRVGPSIKNQKKSTTDDSESMSEATTSGSTVRIKSEVKGKENQDSNESSMEQVRPKTALRRKQSKGSSNSIKVSATDTEESDVSSVQPVTKGSKSKPKRSSSTISQSSKKSSGS